jgi:putative FmdB family regulatory protein
MPIYEYLCHSCGKKFEVLQKFSDPPLLIHPECGGEVDKLISTSALQFKGSGWYVNDYAKNAISKPADTKTESKAEGNRPDGGGESKPESKTETKPAVSESKPAPASAPAADSK